jgi:hypothetical protein
MVLTRPLYAAACAAALIVVTIEPPAWSLPSALRRKFCVASRVSLPSSSVFSSCSRLELP